MSSDPLPTTQTCPEHDPLNQGLARVQQRLGQLAGAQAALRRWTLMIALVLIAQALLFAWALYGTVQRNFLDQERVVAALTPRLEAMYPSFHQEAMNIVARVGPVYKDLAWDRLPTAIPQLVESFETELRQLAQDIPQDIRKTLDISLNRVATRLEPDIQATFPALADPDALDRLTQRFETKVREELAEIALQLEGIYQAEAHRIASVLDNLSPAPPWAMQTMDLERNLLHHLLMLADYELMHPDERGSAKRVFLRLLNTGRLSSAVAR